MAAAKTSKADAGAALTACLTAFNSLEEEERPFLLTWLNQKFGVRTEAARPPPLGHQPADSKSGLTGNDKVSVAKVRLPAAHDTLKDYEEFADLYHQIDPKTGPEQVLVAGYWVQFRMDHSDNRFASLEATKLLTEVNVKIAHITKALQRLGRQNPKLVVQVAKGKGEKGRMGFRVTNEGVAHLLGALARGNDE